MVKNALQVLEIARDASKALKVKPECAIYVIVGRAKRVLSKLVKLFDRGAWREVLVNAVMVVNASYHGAVGALLRAASTASFLVECFK